MKNYSKEIFEMMVNDWMVDHSEDMEALIIDEIKQGDAGWEALAHDENAAYSLIDDGTGNIQLNYIGTR